MGAFSGNNNYSVSTGTSSTQQFVEVFSDRDPTVNDVNYQIRQRWYNKIAESEWLLAAFDSTPGFLQATWVNLSQGLDNPILTLTIPGPVVVSPNTDKSIVFQSDDASVEITSPSPSVINLRTEASGTGIESIDVDGGGTISGLNINILTTDLTATGSLNNAISITELDPATALISVQEAGSNTPTANALNFGMSQYLSDQFDVQGGFVKLQGGNLPAIQTISGVPGDPSANVELTATGNITITPNPGGNLINFNVGAVAAIASIAMDAGTPLSDTNSNLNTAAPLASGTTANAIRTNGLNSGQANIQVQLAGQSVASNPNQFGVAQFSSGQFDVTAGFVNLDGGTNRAIQTVNAPGAGTIGANAVANLNLTSTGNTITFTSVSPNTINLESVVSSPGVTSIVAQAPYNVGPGALVLNGGGPVTTLQMNDALNSPGTIGLNNASNARFNNLSIGSVGVPVNGVNITNGLGVTWNNVVTPIAGTGVVRTSGFCDSFSYGTWVPFLRGGTIAGTGVYEAQRGFWQIVGNVATVFCEIQMNSHTGTGQVQCSLPFLPGPSVQIYGGFGSTVNRTGLPTNLIMYNVAHNNNTNFATFCLNNGSSSGINFPIPNANNVFLTFSITYPLL